MDSIIYMKVLFISDFSLEQNPGGAQVSNWEIIKKGESNGMHIDQFTYDSSPVKLLTQYDLVISSNLESIMRSSNADFVFNYILAHSNHLRLEHDSCSYLPADLRKSLFGSSVKNFFLSNFHSQFFEKLYGNIFPNQEIVYDPIDTEIFNRGGCAERDLDVVYCGFLHPLKGFNNLIDFAKQNPNRKINVFGWAQDNELVRFLESVDNIEFGGKISHKETSEIFKRSKFIFHSPVVNEPFCRMTAEALLCGCGFLGNEKKIGSVLEFKKEGYGEFSNKCRHAAKTFWEKVLNNV